MKIERFRSLLFGASASRKQLQRDDRHEKQKQGAELNQWEAEGGNAALSPSSPERPDPVVDMTGVQQNHASWKDREIERGSHPSADLCLQAEPLDLVVHMSRRLG